MEVFVRNDGILRDGDIDTSQIVVQVLFVRNEAD